MPASKWKKLTREQQAAYRWGLIVAVIGAGLLLLPGRESWHAAGPPNIGHSKIECGECHVPAPGNFAGQAFENIMHAVGLSDSETHFIYQPAGNEQCLRCHEDPDNRHPVEDFLEPEFATARQAIGVQYCVSCHQEHLGVRVSATQGFCRHCHEDTEVSDDPLDVPHSILIADERWGTCLGCHDFHGNHERKVPELMSLVLTEEQIQQYFDGGESPYGHRRLTVIQTMRRSSRSREKPVADPP
ncbi:MAG: hypothetical protein O7G84_19475 [Gammaproteobacteria bacterium]|nr:hypothetical protein [Gammaproteobacteria bacterium]